MQIKDKRVIVTGGASGLGLAFSRELLRNGAAVVVILDIQETAGKQAMEDLNAEFGRNRTIFQYCDVSNSSEFDETFKKIVDTIGGLDVLVNNAAVVMEDNFAKTIDTNVTGVVRGTLLGIQQMRKDSGGKGGVVVNVSSVAGLRACPELPVYSATKHAIVSFSRSFAQPYHYQRSGVRIIVLCPGATQTPSYEKFLEKFATDSDLPQRYRPQRVECVAHSLVYVIRCAQNGSVWVCENGQPVYEVQLPDSLPVKNNDTRQEHEQ